MSAQQNNIQAFFETNENELNIESELNIYNGLHVEFDYNNNDLTSDFSLSLDMTMIS
jgi:hypothetical protein